MRVSLASLRATMPSTAVPRVKVIMSTLVVHWVMVTLWALPSQVA